MDPLVSKIEKPVRQAQRRIVWQQFLGSLGWTGTVAFALGAAIVLAGKFWLPAVSTWMWLGGSAVAAVVAAWAWTLLTRRELLDAAVEVDKQFELKERVTSALALSQADRQTPMGQSLVADAARRVERIDVASRVSARPPRRLLYPLIPAAIAVLLGALVVPPANRSEAKTTPVKTQEQIRNAAKKLERRLNEQRKKAEQRKLPKIDGALALIRQTAKQLQKDAPADRKQALAKLNKLGEELSQQRDQASSAERLRDQLQKMNCSQQGPADEMAQALKQGNFDKAAKELENLRVQLASDSLDKKTTQRLGEQMNQMAEKLQQVAEAHRQAQQELEKQIDQLRAAGQMEQASKLEEQLAKLRQQLPEMNMLNQMACKMKQCSECCKQGQAGQAAQKLGEMSGELADLQQDLDSLEMMDEALDQLGECRDAMCEGDGEGLCQGRQGQRPGGGLPPGHGHVQTGPRGDEVKAGFHDSRLPSEARKGQLSVVGYADGENRKESVDQAIQEQVEAVQQGEADPLTNQQIPRKYRKHAEEYSERLRQGDANSK